MVNDRNVKIVTFVVKFDCQGSADVMFEVKVKVGSRIRRIYCIFDYDNNVHSHCPAISLKHMHHHYNFVWSNGNGLQQVLFCFLVSQIKFVLLYNEGLMVYWLKNISRI